jgi:MFS family permease
LQQAYCRWVMFVVGAGLFFAWVFMQISPSIIFCGVMMPGLLMMLSVIIGRPWRVGREHYCALTAVAIGAGLMIGMPCLVANMSFFPPVSGWHWIFWLGGIVIVLAMIEGVFFQHRMRVLGLCAVAGVGAMLLLARGRMMVGRTWTGEEALLWVSLAAVAVVVSLVSVCLVSARTGPRTPACVLALCAGVAMASVGLNGKSELLAHVAMMGAVCAVMLAGLTILLPHFRVGISVWFAVVLLMNATLWASFDAWYASLPMVDGILIACAPLGAWMGVLGDRQRSYAGPLVGMAASGVLLAVPVYHLCETIARYRTDGFM